MDNYFSLSFEDAIDFLQQQPEDVIISLCNKYNIDSSGSNCINELADLISDNDLLDYGYDLGQESDSTTVGGGLTYQYNDVENIANFLNTNVDDYTLDSLMNQYACTNLTDLAVALSDTELENLGYNSENTSPFSDNLDEEGEEDIFANAKYWHGDYEDDLDFLEDIPHDIPFYVIDANYEGTGYPLLAVDNDLMFERFKESVNPILVDECAVIPEKIDGINNRVLFTVEPHQFQIAEEVVINDKLNENIFDENHQMIPEVRNQILDYVANFVAKMQASGVDINYNDVHLIGSSAGYLYKPDSDIDIHIISNDRIDDEKANQLFDSFDLYEAENPLQFGQHSVELGIEDNYDIKLNNKNPRIYSLTNDNWVNDSDKNEEYKPEDIVTVEGYEEETDKYDKEILDAINEDNYALASKLKAEIRQNRSDNLANIGALSMGNVVFKELRERGTYGKLRDYLNSKELEMANNE